MLVVLVGHVDSRACGEVLAICLADFSICVGG